MKGEFHRIRCVLWLSVATEDYNVLMTNPPYSSDHLQRCLDFCRRAGKPFLLLLPCWVAKKPYFSTLKPLEESMFFVVPLQRYSYTMPPDLVPASCKPSWVGEDGATSPFLSAWYVCVPSMPNFFKAAKTVMDREGPFDCVLVKSLQASKWKLKKAGQTGEAEAPNTARAGTNKRCNKRRVASKKRTVPGTIEFD